MAYDIELISLGKDCYSVLQEAALLLNGVQSEFRFRLPSQALRAQAVSFRREEYLTSDVWNFLRAQRTAFGGNRPYIIAFVTAPLKSSKLGNIFGSHAGAEGLAVVTLDSSTQYVRETRRFCCYYMTRYALSFVNPAIMSHNDAARRNCYFHQKLYKPDIRASMDSGCICDEDQQKLDHPSPDGIGKALSQEEREALCHMRQIVSGDYPHAVIMKGGGVKGLAFAGALLEIQKYYWFDRHVGASAGAIAAVLLAAGYPPADLVDILSKKDFREFKDARTWKVPINLLFKGGCYPGDHFFGWIANLLKERISKQSEVLMSDLNGAVIYASRRGPGTVVFDSDGEHRDTPAAFATRCSMSIPIFFVPQPLEGRPVYDGGLRNNFPLARFLKDHPGSPFIALYLTKTEKENKGRIWTDLLDIWIDGEDRAVIDANPNSVVVIDTSPVNTVDFHLPEIEKDFLLKVGKASALMFLKARNLDDGPCEAVVQAAVKEAEACRGEVKRRRARRRVWRFTGAIAFCAFVITLWFLARYGQWLGPIDLCREKQTIEVLGVNFTEHTRRIVKEAGAASNNQMHARPEVVRFTWKRPLLFEAKHFELRLNSRAYELAGFAVQNSSKLEIASCRINRSTIAVSLETAPKEAYLFFIRKIPAADNYDSEHVDPDLNWSISHVGQALCASRERH